MKSISKSKSVRATRTKNMLGIFALVGLFACGLTVGLTWTDNSDQPVQLSKSQCDNLKSKMDFMIFNNEFGALKDLQAFYADACAHPVADAVVKQAPQAESVELNTCQKIESLLLEKIYGDGNPDFQAHEENAEIYKKLATEGCPENTVMYTEKAASEMQIARVLYETDTNQMRGIVAADADVAPCTMIEDELSGRLHKSWGAQSHLNDAYVYMKMAKYGCGENAQKNMERARAQMQIVAATMSDDELRSWRREIIEINDFLGIKTNNISDENNY